MVEAQRLRIAEAQIHVVQLTFSSRQHLVLIWRLRFGSRQRLSAHFRCPKLRLRLGGHQSESSLHLAKDLRVGDLVILGKHKGLRENDGQQAIALEGQPHTAVLAPGGRYDAEIVVV